MDNTDPEIEFDENGICNHCINYDKKIKSLPQGEEANIELNRIINEIKRSGRNKRYDCVIGLSGGVDSTYVAYEVKKMGLNPLAVHLDNGWNSELAMVNIENIVKKLNIDLFTYVIDWEEFKDIQLSFLKSSTPDSEVPTDHAIFAILRQVARKHKIKYVINGINIKTEGHHVLSWSQGHSDFGYIKAIQKQFGTKKIKTFPHGNVWTIFQDRFSKKWVNILNYLDYNKDHAKTIIQKELDWRDYGGKHFESRYTKYYQGVILPNKFNFDKRKMHYSSLICAGEMSREDALLLLKEPTYSRVEQLNDEKYIIKKLNITNEEFQRIMDLPKKNYFDYPSYYGRFLKNKVVIKIKRCVFKLIKKSR
jgi:N-acetyl sugar amidotransferase